MKTIDMRFDSNLIRGWLGKEFKKYKSDAFDFTNSVTQIVGLYIGDNVYALTNVQETVDYFGNTDDIAVSKLFLSEDISIKSAFVDVDMISTPIGNNITAAKLVNEHQELSINGEHTHDVYLTRAIIIEVGNQEISFEKDTVPFSEEITIQKGYDLLDKVSDNDGFLEGWGEEYNPTYSREIIEIR